MATKYHQLSLSETFTDCQNLLIEFTPSFFQILSQYFDLDQFILIDFQSAFYLSMRRKRIYSLV